ncbi:MAG TPA: methyltransferase domain-containing protein [Baekduia sp.]|nr:methyltransferase domain-containing protein [Baekduia sp.]
MSVAPVLSLVPDRRAGLDRVALDPGVWAATSRALIDDLELLPQARVHVAEDVLGAGAPAASFDLVHARFQLCRHGRPAEQIEELRRLVAPGGVLVIEEPDLRTWTYQPYAPATTHLIGRLAQAFSAAGGNLDAGTRLPALLRGAGLTPRVRTHTLGLEAGHSYLRLPLDLGATLGERLADVLGDDGLDQLRRAATAELLAPERRGTTFTLVQAWARVD